MANLVMVAILSIVRLDIIQDRARDHLIVHLPRVMAKRAVAKANELLCYVRIRQLKIIIACWKPSGWCMDKSVCGCSLIT